jgi:hypothetical protein
MQSPIMRTPNFVLGPCAALLLASAASAQLTQTLPSGFDTVQGAAGSSYPFNTTLGQIWQWHYANSNFTQTGPITITEIHVRASSAAATVSAFDFPSVDVWCSEALTQYPLATHDPVFANNLGPNTALVRTGPWTGGPVPPSGGTSATWIPMGLTTPFVFDPSNGSDFIIQIEKCATNATWATLIDGRILTGPNTVGGNRYGHLSDCNATSHDFSNNEYVPIVKIDYVLGGGGPSVYCTAGTSTNGCVPAITADNQPSLSQANPCNVTVANVEGQKSGLIFYGVDNSGFVPTVWGLGGTSYLCVKAPTQRTNTQSSGGTLLQCDGSLALDWNAFQSANPASLGNPWAAGHRVFAQAWYRDPPAPKTTNLSDAVELTYAP